MARLIIKQRVGPKPVHSLVAGPAFDGTKKSLADASFAGGRLDPQILHISGTQTRGAFGIIADPAIDKSEGRTSLLGKEGDIRFGQGDPTFDFLLKGSFVTPPIEPRQHRCPYRPIRAQDGADDQTVKLSPQPQLPLALGFSNTKPAVKSSSLQSITEPMR